MDFTLHYWKFIFFLLFWRRQKIHFQLNFFSSHFKFYYVWLKTFIVGLISVFFLSLFGNTTRHLREWAKLRLHWQVRFLSAFVHSTIFALAPCMHQSWSLDSNAICGTVLVGKLWKRIENMALSNLTCELVLSWNILKPVSTCSENMWTPKQLAKQQMAEQQLAKRIRLHFLK